MLATGVPLSFACNIRMPMTQVSTPEEVLVEAGLELPALPAPGGNYVSAKRVGEIVYLAGAISKWLRECRLRICGLPRCDRFHLHKRRVLAGPIVEASETIAPDSHADSWVMIATGTDLLDASRGTTNRMIDFLMDHWGFSDVHAYMLCSVAMRLRLSQVVNEPVHTVSASISKTILAARELFALR